NALTGGHAESKRRFEPRRPVGEPCVPGLRQLTESPGTLIEHPDVALISDGAETASDWEMAPIGGIRRIFILSFRCELSHHPIFDSYRPHLEIAVLLLERDLVTSGRPVRPRSIAALSRHHRRQKSQA